MTRQDQPHVGICWLFEDRVIIDATPLSQAEPYGDCLTHPTSHIDYWTTQRDLGALPREIEYEEPPRGRVVFNTKTRRFALYADRCILKRKSVVAHIMKAMQLPASQTDVTTDGHYRCSQCMTLPQDPEDDCWGS